MGLPKLLRGALRRRQASGRRTPPTDVHVRLLGEGIDGVWRPVITEDLGDGRYRIAEQERNADESWQFQPSDVVIAEVLRDAEGRPFLAATRKAEQA
jgi:hypothetical protein